MISSCVVREASFAGNGLTSSMNHRITRRLPLRTTLHVPHFTEAYGY